MNYLDYHDQDEAPESTRMVGGIEHVTVAEFLRRLDPVQYPIVDDLMSRHGNVDRTYQVLGSYAATRGKLLGVKPAAMYHPEFGSVNGWPIHVIRDAWTAFLARYRGSMRWELRDETRVQPPQPISPPSPPYDARLLAQIRTAVERRGVNLKAASDPRWRQSFQMLLQERPDETPEQAMIRRNSAAAALFVIEKEYQG